MDTQNQSHSHLYIALGLLVLFAAFFFVVGIKKEGDIAPAQDSTPLELKRIVLSAEERQKREEEARDPALSAKLKLTKTELEQRKKELEDPMLTARISNQ